MGVAKMCNNKIIVIYKSKTGFTKKYANWISQELRCDAVSLREIRPVDLKPYDIVIFGGGIHAGRINGISFIKNNMFSLKDKKVIVFATGATASIPNEIERFKNTNTPNDKNIAFFYFQSGLNYANMHGSGKVLMGLLKTVLKMKKNKSELEQGTEDAIQSSYDFSNRDQIEPLISFINELKNI